MTPVKAIIRRRSSGEMSSDALSSPPEPKRLSFSSSEKKKQSGIMSFFPPRSGLSSAVLENLPEAPEPPKKTRHRMEDAIRAMVRRGELHVGGQQVKLGSMELAELSREAGKRGGRPVVPLGMRRGVMGGQSSNHRRVDEKPRKQELPMFMKHVGAKAGV